MSQSLGELIWALGFDNTGLKKGTQEAGAQFESMGKTLKDAMANQRQLIKEITLDIKNLNEAAKSGTFNQKTGAMADLTAAKKVLADEQARLLDMQKASTEANQAESQSQGGLLSGLGKWALGLATVAAAMKAFHSIVNSTEGTAKQFEFAVAGAEAGLGYFWKTLATGDFSNFFDNMQRAIKSGHDFAEAMHEVKEAGWAQSINESLQAKTNTQNEITLRDTSKPKDVRLAAGETRIKDEERFAKVRTKNAEDELNSWMKVAEERSGIDKEAFEASDRESWGQNKLLNILKNVNEETKIKAELYNKNIAKVQDDARKRAGYISVTDAEKKVSEGIPEEVKLYAASLREKATLTEEMILGVVNSVVKVGKADDSAISGLRRVFTTVGGIKKQFADDEEAAAKKRKDAAELDARIKATELAMQKAAEAGNIKELEALAKKLALLEAQKKLIDAMVKSAKAMAENKPIEAKGPSNVYSALYEALGTENVQPNRETQAKSVTDRLKKDADDAIKKTQEEQKLKGKGITASTKEQNKEVRELADTFYDVADAAQKFANIIGDSNKELAGTISAVANIAGQMGDLAKKGAFAKGGSTMSTSDAITAGIGGATQILGVILGQAQANKQVQDDWNKSIEQAALDYAMLTIEAAAYHEANIFGIENPYSRAIAGAKQYGVAMGEMAKQAVKLEGGQVQTGTKKVASGTNIATAAGGGAAVGAAVGSIVPVIGTAIGAGVGAIVGGLIGLFAAKKRVAVFESLKSQYGEIYNKDTFELNPRILADYAKLDDKTKQLVDNWKSIKEAAKAAQDEMTANFQSLAGDLGTSLKDSIIAAFNGGDTFAAIDDFHKKIGDVIADIVYQMLFAQFMQPFFDKAQEGFNQSFGMITDANTGKLRQMTDTEKQAKDKFGKAVVDYSITDDIEALADDTTTGMAALDGAMKDADKTLKDKGFSGGLGGSKAKTDTAAGQIKAALTEDTGTQLMGLWRRGIDESITQTGILSMSNGYLYAIEINTRRTADNTEFLKTSGTTNGRDKG